LRIAASLGTVQHDALNPLTVHRIKGGTEHLEGGINDARHEDLLAQRRARGKGAAAAARFSDIACFSHHGQCSITHSV
jgi:hypothetical protein